MIICKCNCLLFLFFPLLLSPIKSAAGDSDFVTDALFFTETLHDKLPGFDLESFQLDSRLSDVEQKRQDSFKVAADSIDDSGSGFDTYHLNFKNHQGEQFSCLGALLKFSNNMLESELGQYYVDRSAKVFIDQCLVSKNGSLMSPARRPTFTYYIVFPLLENLPISGLDSLTTYQKMKSVDANKKHIHCVSRDVNVYKTPRFMLAVYDQNDFVTLSVNIGTSGVMDPKTLDVEKDIPIDVGPQDLKSLGWFERNIEFFKTFGQGTGSAFSVIFPKDNCRSYYKENQYLMSCQMSVTPQTRSKNITDVYFTFQTEDVTKILPNTTQDSAVLIKEKRLNAEIYFVTERPAEQVNLSADNIFRTNINFTNKANGSSYEECQIAPEGTF